MSESERVAIAARLHVQLRRVSGRVTDTEWMATNLEYADDVVRHAREVAREKNLSDLAEIAQRLEAAMLPLRPPPPKPRAPVMERTPREDHAQALQARYIGRLR